MVIQHAAAKSRCSRRRPDSCEVSAGPSSAVAVEIDDAELTEIVGTLAGEDTIFIAVPDSKGPARRD